MRARGRRGTRRPSRRMSRIWSQLVGLDQGIPSLVKPCPNWDSRGKPDGRGHPESVVASTLEASRDLGCLRLERAVCLHLRRVEGGVGPHERRVLVDKRVRVRLVQQVMYSFGRELGLADASRVCRSTGASGGGRAAGQAVASPQAESRVWQGFVHLVLTLLCGCTRILRLGGAGALRGVGRRTEGAERRVGIDAVEE